MKKVNKLKILTVILMGILILCSAKMSFAAQSITAISTSTGNTGNNNINNISTNTDNSNNLNNTGNDIQNNSSNNLLPVNNAANTQNTVLPDAGAKSSATIVFLIVLTSISAIYTYKKVKEYNI